MIMTIKDLLEALEKLDGETFIDVDCIVVHRGQKIVGAAIREIKEEPEDALGFKWCTLVAEARYGSEEDIS
ncbi:MAG: hypothetical protein IJI68_03310 [Eggerthellaceae bacterium]|nr:hypothetical protein [Eggerthellaceae bacterium]